MKKGRNSCQKSEEEILWEEKMNQRLHPSTNIKQTWC
jgi:hypothetical protein